MGHLVAQADLHYYQGRWQEAIDVYLEGRKLLGDKSPLFQRITLESIARCYLKLGDYEAAYVWAHKLLDFSQSNEHRVVAHNLVSIICRELCNFREEADHLRYCLSRLPLNGIHWFHLGRCFSSMATREDRESSSRLGTPFMECSHLHPGYVGGNGEDHPRSAHSQSHSACRHGYCRSVSDHDSGRIMDGCGTRTGLSQCRDKSERTENGTTDATIGSYGRTASTEPVSEMSAMRNSPRESELSIKCDKHVNGTPQPQWVTEVLEIQSGMQGLNLRSDGGMCDPQEMLTKGCEVGGCRTGKESIEGSRGKLGSRDHSNGGRTDIELTERGQQNTGCLTSNGGIQRVMCEANGGGSSDRDTAFIQRAEQSETIRRGMGDSEEIQQRDLPDRPTVRGDIPGVDCGGRDSHDEANMSHERGDGAYGKRRESESRLDDVHEQSHYYKYALICYIRARILLKPISSLCNKQHQAVLSEVNKHLEALRFPEQFVSRLSQLCWKRQFGIIDQKQGNVDERATSSAANGDYIESVFEEYWFQGILEQVDPAMA